MASEGPFSFRGFCEGGVPKCRWPRFLPSQERRIVGISYAIALAARRRYDGIRRKWTVPLTGVVRRHSNPIPSNLAAPRECLTDNFQQLLLASVHSTQVGKRQEGIDGQRQAEHTDHQYHKIGGPEFSNQPQGHAGQRRNPVVQVVNGHNPSSQRVRYGGLQEGVVVDFERQPEEPKAEHGDQ